jgi:iron complex outermembrane receptor protein
LTTALRPQNSRDVEVGVKWSQSTGTNLTIRVFEQKTTDEIAFDRLCGSMGCNTNLDPTSRQGVELEGRFAIQNNVQLQGSLQSVDAKFSEGPYAGKRIPAVAGVSAAARILWSIDTHQSLNVGAQFLGNSRFTNDVAGRCSDQMADRTLFDARYAWTNRKVEVSVAAMNLTDQRSYSYAITNATCSAVNVYPDPGRTLKAAVKYNF